MVGWIVTDETQVPMCIEINDQEPFHRRGVLYRCGKPAVFSSRERAKGAIKRTINYASSEGLDWPATEYDYGILKVEFVP